MKSAIVRRQTVWEFSSTKLYDVYVEVVEHVLELKIEIGRENLYTLGNKYSAEAAELHVR